jgi:hypothetical protein
MTTGGTATRHDDDDGRHDDGDGRHDDGDGWHNDSKGQQATGGTTR